MYAVNPYEIPRGHWKWAGIKEPHIKPVQPVWLQTMLRERNKRPPKVVQNYTTVFSAQPKEKNILKKSNALMYNKKGNACYGLTHPLFETYC